MNRYAKLWLISLWRSTVSWAGLLLCGVRAMWPQSDIGTCQRIAVVQLGHFGDMVLTIPLLGAIKKRNPQACLRVITTPAGAAVAGAFGSQDELLVPTPQESCGTALADADYVIHLRGGVRWVMGAFVRPRLGFIHGLPHRSALRWAPLTLLSIPINRREPEHQYLTLVRRMKKHGVRMPHRPYLDVEPQPPPESWAPASKYVVIHAGGGWEPRRWSGEGFARVAALLWQKMRLRTVVIAGHETPNLFELLEKSETPFHMLDSSMSVRALAGVLKGASVFLGNDSGPAHLAAALDVPSIVLYGPQDPRLFGILSDTGIVLQGGACCSPCWQILCPFSQVRCLEKISIEVVHAAVCKALSMKG